MSTRPDAVKFPASVKQGRTGRERRLSVVDVADGLLKPDLKAGEKSWLREQPGGVIFATRDGRDSLSYPFGHPREGQPRYRWEDMGQGVWYGYLIHPAEPIPEADSADILRQHLEALARGD